MHFILNSNSQFVKMLSNYVMRNTMLFKELKYKRSTLLIKKKNENNYIGNESKKKAAKELYL